MKFLQIFVVAIFVFFAIGCNNTEEVKTENNTGFTGSRVTVNEVLDGSTYTYLNVTENDAQKWIAISKRDTKVGEVLYYTDALEMQNFESKELGKTFELIYFVSSLGNEPTMASSTMPAHGNVKDATEAEIDNIEPVKGGITIEELYKNKDDYSGKTVLIKGLVTKFNEGIMDRNWVHLQDGTKHMNAFDITITTDATVQVGDIATFKGTITLSKDFGAGYFYEIIMESATLE